MGACNTCIAEGRGRVMSAAEALIHKDCFPNHEVIPVNEEPVPQDDDFGVVL